MLKQDICRNLSRKTMVIHWNVKLSIVLLLAMFVGIMANTAFAEPFTAFSPRNMDRLQVYYEQSKALYGGAPGKNREMSGRISTEESKTHTDGLIQTENPSSSSLFDFSSMPKLTIEHDNFYANDKQIKGIFVNWFIHDKATDRAYFRREISAMKDSGIIGISLEVPWADSEIEENNYSYPEYIDAIMDEAAAQGLWVSVLLSPHYAPQWLYEKYGDIYLYDASGRQYFWDNFGTDVDEKASYINYSYHSPAVGDQIEWQQEAVNHYARHPNLFTVFVGNEQIHDRSVLIDYSHWAEEDWYTWLDENNYKKYDMPRDLSAEQANLWQEFRSESLNSYLNTVYTEVKKTEPRFIPIGHRMLLYHSYSSEAPMYAYQPGQFTVGMDFLGNDNYSFSPSVNAAQISYRKPVFIGETSLQGPWSEEGIYLFIMTQFYLGADIQSVYVWNKKPYDYALTTMSGSLTTKGEGVRRAAQEINGLNTIDTPSPKILIVLPNTQFALHADDFRSYQYKLDTIFDTLLQSGMLPAFIWENDLHDETEEKWAYINQFDYMLLPFTGDYMQAPLFYKWVNNGGIAYKTVLFDHEKETWHDTGVSPYQCLPSQKGEICTIENLDTGLFRIDTAFNLYRYPVRLLHLIVRHIQAPHGIRR